MKKILVMMFLFSFLALGVMVPMISAQEELENPGVTPDSPLWGLDRALEQIQLLLTIGSSSKAKIGLEIANERLAEIKEMIEENKLGAAEKAKENHGKALGKVKERIEGIEDEDSEEEIKEVIEVEKELDEHEQEVEQISGELKIKIKIKGELTEEQQALIDSILASLEGQIGEVKIEIKNKKNKTKIKIKIETGKSDEEIEEDIEKFEIEAGMDRIKAKAKIVGSQSGIKIEKRFSTTTIDKDAIISEIIEQFAFDREIADVALKIEEEEGDEELEEKLKVKVRVKDGVAKVEVKLKFILDTIDREEILNAIVENSQLTTEQIESALKFKDKEKEDKDDGEIDEERELEIEVEIENGVAEIEVDFNGDEFEFTLETTDREEIIAEIIERTGLTREEIDAVIKFDIEGEDEEEDDDETEDDNSDEDEEDDGEETNDSA